MADFIPGGPAGEDPLGDRLRATFSAERADIERRHLAAGATPRTARSFVWIPFAAAAAVLAIAGFLFIGNRTDTTAIDLGVAGQAEQADPSEPNPDLPGPTSTDVPLEVVTVPSAAAVPAGVPLPVPFAPGDNMCGDWLDPAVTIVWTPDNSAAPTQTKPEPTGDFFLNRQLPPGTIVTQAGGCTAGTTQLGPRTFYEIDGDNGQPADWINADFLTTREAYDAWVADGITPPRAPGPDGGPIPFPSPPAPGINACDPGQPIFPVQFVLDIPSDDPDGGLVAHTAPGINEPVTRILLLDEVVTATGRCELSSSGTPWYELLADDGSLDWASGNFLGEPAPACLSGEQYGTRAIDSTHLIYDIRAGDSLGGIAVKFDITPEELFAANPSLDPSALRLGQTIWIPGSAPDPQQLLGPIEGLALEAGDRVAFAAQDASHYLWFDVGAVLVGAPCFMETPSETACLVGWVRMVDLNSPEPILTRNGPLDVTTTGRVIAEGSFGAGLVEVIVNQDGAVLTGLIDPVEAELVSGRCVATRPDALGDVPCTAADSSVQVGTTERGSALSSADHVHQLRFEQSADAAGLCTRIVLELGSGVFGADSGPRRLANQLPLITIDKRAQSTRIRLPESFGLTVTDIDARVDATGVMALLAQDLDRRPTLTVLYDQAGPVNVWFLENPARVIIDYANPAPPPADMLAGPFGENFVLTQPLQSELRGRGLTAGEAIVVQGFGRPFEAQGSYRIYAVTPDVDPFAFLVDPPAPLVDGPLMTSGWTDGWGSFQIDLPELAPGTYVALFGDSPPNDEIDFIGAGQLFRIAAQDDPTADVYPPAILLPDVRIDN